MEHNVIPAVQRHGPFTWEVADSAARLALTTLVGDIGKKLWQKDNNTEWVCTAANTFVPTSVVTEKLRLDPAGPGSGNIYLTKISSPDGSVQVTCLGTVNLSISSAAHTVVTFPTGWAPTNGLARFPLFRNDDGSTIASLSAGTDFWIEVTTTNILRIRNATGAGGVSFNGVWPRVFPT